MRLFYAVAALLSIYLCSGFALASIPSQPLAQFLQSINVSQSTQNSLSYVNISYKGMSYLLAYDAGSPYLLINQTNGYSLVAGTQQISGIISQYFIAKSLTQVNTTYLSSALYDFNQSSAGPITDCLTETGLNQPNASCTAANFCESCRAVPICGGPQKTPQSLLSVVGYNSPLTTGIQNLQANYTWLVQNITLYNNAVGYLKYPSTAQEGITDLNSAIGSIASITENIYQNPLFPPGPTEPACSPSTPQSQQPWYCVAYGFCQSTTYNYTKLSNLQSYISRINLLNISSGRISQLSQAINSTEQSYAALASAKAALRQRNVILNTTLSGYNTVASGSSALLLNITNQSLSAALQRANANYSKLLENYASANLIPLNSTLKTQYLELKSLYGPLDSAYNNAVSLSLNNTLILLSLGSGESQPPPDVAALSFRQAQLEAELSLKPSNITSVQSGLESVNTAAKSIPQPENPAVGLARQIGAPIATAIIGPSSLQAGIDYAPILSIIPAIIISAAILAALLMFSRNLSKRGKIRRSRSTRRNWKRLFAVVIVVLALYIIGSYVSAVNANSGAPLQVAASAISGAKHVAVAINGTSNPALASCSAKIVSELSNESKNVTSFTINGDACRTGSGISTTDQCLAKFAYEGTPVIILTNSTKNTMSAYSFYGTILSQNGGPGFTSECLAAVLLR